MSNQRVSVVVLGIILKPIFKLVVHAIIAKISDANDRSDILRNIVSFAHSFAHHVDRFGRRVGVESIEEDETGVQVVARTNLDWFLCGDAVIDNHDVVLKGSDLNSPPAYLLNHSGVLLCADRYHVADLKRSIGL